MVEMGEWKEGKKAIVVTAHPDDESLMSVTLWKLTRELGFSVDIVVMTNGEGGHAHSKLAKIFYGEENLNIGNKRKQEMSESANILGLRNVIFLEQADAGYTLNLSVIFPSVEYEGESNDITNKTGIWDNEFILNKLTDLLSIISIWISKVTQINESTK